MNNEDWMDEDTPDPFSLLGKVRIIILRHNPYSNYKGELDNCIRIIHVDGLYNGFSCDPKTKKFNKRYPKQNYRDDVEMCEHKINQLFKNKPNGMYEMIGDMYAWSSQSWEGDWDGDTEVRNPQIQPISFDDAMKFEEIGMGLYDDLVSLYPLAFHNMEPRPQQAFNTDYDIHPCMEKVDIYRAHANVLSRIIEFNYRSTSFHDSTVEQLQACIHMMMMQIDSEKSYEDKRDRVQLLDSKVVECLREHERMMAFEPEE